jgi:4-hydroxy-4-methyl-2-oxoglutarate aldolase
MRTMGDVGERFESLSTALVADAVVRLGLAPKIAPSGIRPLVNGAKLAGPASPVVLDGHADRVLECIYRNDEGAVVVLDDKGRADEARFGDLAAYESRSQGLAGVVIWGRHRTASRS